MAVLSVSASHVVLMCSCAVQNTLTLFLLAGACCVYHSDVSSAFGGCCFVFPTLVAWRVTSTCTADDMGHRIRHGMKNRGDFTKVLGKHGMGICLSGPWCDSWVVTHRGLGCGGAGLPCSVCSAASTLVTMTLDVVCPVSQPGSSTTSTRVWLCASCPGFQSSSGCGWGGCNAAAVVWRGHCGPSIGGGATMYI